MSDKPNKEEILRIARERINNSLQVQDWWRANEIRDNYQVVEGDQWFEDTYRRQNNDGMPVRTINKLSPVINSICGFEIQNRSEVNYVPRQANTNQQGFSDMLNDVVNYIESDSKSDFQASLAFRDMLICGVGITDTTIKYDNNPDGEVVVDRVFPYFILWDVTARAKNLEDANWVIRAKVVDRDSMKDFLKDYDEADEVSGGVDARFLEYFDTVMISKSLDVIYEYQWREKKPFYRVENPLMNKEGKLDPMIAQFIPMITTQENLQYVTQSIDQSIANILIMVFLLKKELDIDLAQDRIFSLESKDHKKVKDLFETLDLNFKAIKQKKYKYYRCLIVGNNVVDLEENFSQTGFSIKFMTGYFSEIRQCYYGIVRAAKEPQRMLNQAVSDYEGFLRTIPKGGVEIEADAVPNMAAFIETYTKAREVTIYNPGGLGKTRPKITPPIPSGLLDMINFASNSIMETSGITQDFMGLVDSKMMTAQLNRQLVRQGLTTLSAYFDAKKFYTINQGRLFIDCVKILTDNAEGRLIRVMEDGGAKYIPLLRDGIAAEYDIIVEDIPETPSERQDTFEKLMNMAALLANKPNPVDITPLVVQYSPLKGDEISKIMEIMQPPPPTPPDPVSQNLLLAETQLKSSTAQKNEAEAMKTKLEILQMQKELGQVDQELIVELEKAKADIGLTRAKTAREKMMTIQSFRNREG